MRPLLATALLASTLAACAVAPPAPLPLTELASGRFGPCAAPRREVVRDPARWDQVWAEVQPSRTAPPPVDFAGQVALVACLGERRTGGYAIEIVAVEVGETELVVTVRETAPLPGAMTSQALTQPYHAVRVAKTTLPVRWVNAR
jgi:hypothetical protein